MPNSAASRWAGAPFGVPPLRARRGVEGAGVGARVGVTTAGADTGAGVRAVSREDRVAGDATARGRAWRRRVLVSTRGLAAFRVPPLERRSPSWAGGISPPTLLGVG